MVMDFKKNTKEELTGFIESINNELNSRKKTCTHDKIKYKFGSNTGNYCEADDCYWVDVECLDCKWSFHYTNDQPEYKMRDIGKVLKVNHEEYLTLSKFGKV